LVDASRPKTDSDPFVMGPSLGLSQPYDLDRTLFGFYHLQPGRYLIRISLAQSNNMSAFYYPGVRSIREAKVIEIGSGTMRNLKFNLRELRAVTISGRMQLTDGTPVPGVPALVDADRPSVSEVLSGVFTDGKFRFQTIKGRPAYICADYYDERNGRR